jgi:ankyrin repeat protein
MTTPLIIAVKNGDFEIVKLLSAKSNINFQDQYGFSALHYAAYVNNYDIVTYLLSQGAKTLLQSLVSALSGHTIYPCSDHLHQCSRVAVLWILLQP